MTAIRKALAALPDFPGDCYLTINSSPDTILSNAFTEALDGIAGERVVLEVTEHAQVANYEALLRALALLRARGFRLAVDDAGAGYSSLRHILDLRPDFIKLDMSLTRDIDTDPARRALASALIHFAHKTGSKIVAEGVETEGEFLQLKALGVEKVQGYLLGRPTPLAEAAALARQISACRARPNNPV